MRTVSLLLLYFSTVAALALTRQHGTAVWQIKFLQQKVKTAREEHPFNLLVKEREKKCRETNYWWKRLSGHKVAGFAGSHRHTSSDHFPHMSLAPEHWFKADN
jgi:hypothetical protein